MQQSTSLFHKLIVLTKGQTIQPKLDRMNPVKSATFASVMQYRCDTTSDVRWTVRKHTPTTAATPSRPPMGASPTQITYSISSSQLQLERLDRNDGRGWNRYHTM